MVKWAQLGGIVRYEALIQWRRRGVLVLMVVLAATLILVELSLGRMGRTLNAELMAEEGLVATPEIIRAQGTVGMYYAWWVTMLLIILAVPPILADTIPRDRQAGVGELVRSLPVGHGIRLSGKLLAGWAGLAGGLACVMALSGLAGRLVIGPYLFGAYLLLWLVGLLPLALFTAGMSILLAAWQPNRRRATFVGAAFSAYCVTMLVTTTGTVWDAVSLARPSIFLSLPAEYNPLRMLSSLGLFSYPAYQIPLTIGLGALQVALAWLAVWAWERTREEP